MYNEIAKQTNRKLGISLSEQKSIWTLSGRDFSNSRATAYFKGVDNPRFLEMRFGEFKDWLFGVCQHQQIDVARPESLEDCLSILEGHVFKGLTFSAESTTPESITRKIHDFSS